MLENTVETNASSSSSRSKRLYDELISREYIPPKVLERFFTSLEPVEFDELWGLWRGNYFYSGNKWGILLQLPILRWYGKRFRHQDDVEALMFELIGVRFPMPIGRAYVEMLKFKGRTSAAMIYRYLPVTDHFRKIDNDTLMGIMDARIPGVDPFYFYLNRSQ